MSLEEALSKETFDVSKFLKTALKAEAGGDDVRKLKELRKKVQSLSEESASSIRKNVFENYTQFIETAKEISYLETEMYQLNHLLTEQKTLIETMMEMPFGGATKDGAGSSLAGPGAFSEGKKSFQVVLEKVDGASHMMENPNRCLVMESDLTELNQDNGRPIRTVHAFLLSDGLMITQWNPQKLGTMRYKLDSVTSFDSLAMINQKDSDVVRNAIKLLVFPHHKLFSCENARLKRKWLDSFEKTKNAMLQEGSLARQATIRSKRESNPKASEPGAYGQHQQLSEDGMAELEWFKELPDELDVCIAQRDFETAVELLFEGRENLGDCPDKTVAREVEEKLINKERTLGEVLGRELKVGPDKTMQGGPKAARRAISLLIKMGKSSQACDLYLKNRTGIMKQVVRELRIADDPLSYLRHLTKVLFGNLNEAAREFTNLFAGNSGCFSVLMLWVGGELKNYVNLVLRHVIDPGPSLTVIGQAVRIIHSQCESLAQLGLDFTFEIDKLMGPAVQRTLEENGRNLTEAVRLRIQEDKWKPNNLQSESSLNKFLEEMQDFGIKLDIYVCEDSLSNAASSTERCRLWLTVQMCQFARTGLQLARDLAPLRIGETLAICDRIFFELWRLELEHVRKELMARNRPPQQKTVVDKCANFIVGTLLPLCEDAFTTGGSVPDWHPLQELLAKEFPLMVSFRAPDTRQFEMIGDV